MHINVSKAQWCKHYNGTVNPACKIGVEYATVRQELHVAETGRTKFAYPCTDDCGGCEKKELRTAEELAAIKAERDHHYECFKKGISPCCNVPINDSRVIKEGRHKGHGARYCSKCGKCLFIV